MIENLIKKKDSESAMVTLTKKRIRLNLNMFCMFTGKLGAGKTWSAISFAEELDDEFNVQEQVVFDFKTCMNLINEEWFRNKKVKIIIWDEPQISINNRAWQSKLNRLVNYLISTFRHQNIILMMCAPYKDFLDSQTMKLLQWEFQCSSIDRKNKQCIVYLKYQQYNPQKKRTYPHPLFVLDGGRRMQIDHWAISKPKPDSIDIYEGNKTEFTKGLNKSIQETLDSLDKSPEMIEKKEIKLPEASEEYSVLYEKLKESNPQVKRSNVIKMIAEITGTQVRNIQTHLRKAKIKKFREEEIEKNEKKAPLQTMNAPLIN